VDHRKGAQKGRETCPVRALDGFNEIRLSTLERMAGTTRLELATSAVTVQQLTRPRGLPNYAEVVQDISYCGLGCGLGIRRFQTSHMLVEFHRPTYLPACLYGGRTCRKWRGAFPGASRARFGNRSKSGRKTHDRDVDSTGQGLHDLDRRHRYSRAEDQLRAGQDLT